MLESSKLMLILVGQVLLYGDRFIDNEDNHLGHFPLCSQINITCETSLSVHTKMVVDMLQKTKLKMLQHWNANGKLSSKSLVHAQNIYLFVMCVPCKGITKCSLKTNVIDCLQI